MTSPLAGWNIALLPAANTVPAILTSIQVGLPREYAGNETGDSWVSAIFKDPVGGPVWLGQTGLEGDRQADLKAHGGPNKAVLAYSADHYPLWRAEWNQPDIPFGGFGENLTVSGLEERTVCLGDDWSVGDALLQVSQPRTPCWKLARRWNRPDLPQRVIATGRSGWYLRVLRPGNVQAGSQITLQERPLPQWSIARISELLYAPDDRAAARELAECPLLSPGWRRAFAERAER